MNRLFVEFVSDGAAGVGVAEDSLFDQEILFIGILILAFMLDLIDGPIARWTNQVSEIGPVLDSFADFSVYLAYIFGAWYLWPEIILRELVYVCLLAVSILLPALSAYLKFRQASSYHTWLVKFAVLCMAPASLILFLGGPAWPFRVASIISVFAGLEEIIITLVLDKPRSDVVSIFHVISDRKSTDDNVNS